MRHKLILLTLFFSLGIYASARVVAEDSTPSKPATRETAAQPVAEQNVVAEPTPEKSPVVKTQKSGLWSEASTWDAGRVPTTGDRVIIRAGDHVTYDVRSNEVIRLVQIAGVLEFARDKDTQLEAGLITIMADEFPTEAGFDCHATPEAPSPGAPVPALLVGTQEAPISPEFRAIIRLHYVEGMDKASCPAIVCCAGRMEFHGAPLARTWVKLKRQAERNATFVAVAEEVPGWKREDQVIITSTHRQRDRSSGEGEFEQGAETEERRLLRVSSKPSFNGGYELTLDRPLSFTHFADADYQAEVGLLTRNVIVESADPEGIRAHTMYHRYSKGSISYAEFRHLGKRNELGRYSIHFHLCGDTMRGSSVIGASIWDSHNRWITIHGTEDLVVRDCVGYKSIGHGYFLEDGTEINNVLDHNLAALVSPGKPLPKQVIPFDPNRGAGFWWANCRNTFTRNVAAECAEYGYRFDCKQTADFNPLLSITQPDGTSLPQDIRSLPFVRFQDNEAHTMRFFCLNLRGVTRPDRGLDLYSQNETLQREAAESQPQPGQPFWIRDFKCWEANWATHLGTTGVFLDGLQVFRSDVGIWRSIMDRSGFRRMSMKEMRVNDIHNPLSMGWNPDDDYPEENQKNTPPTTTAVGTDSTQPVSTKTPERERSARQAFGGVSSFRDDMPPTTVVTQAIRKGNLVHLRGTTSDSSDIKQVIVNGSQARSTRASFAEWEITLFAPEGKPLEISAYSEDVLGLVEPRPHQLVVE